MRKAAGPDSRMGEMGTSFSYDIHGILAIASAVSLPELRHFSVGRVAEPDIVVSIGPGSNADGRDEVVYSELFRGLGFVASISRGSTTHINVSRLVKSSPHVLYTNVVEPVLRWAFVARGFALVHAACVERDGLAFLITARTDTGKTTTALKMLRGGRSLGFVSDDLTLVSADGEVLCYPKPMTISRHTLHAVPKRRLTAWERFKLVFQSRLHSRSGRRAGLLLAKTRLPAATMNAITQKLVPPPKYHLSKLLPEVKVTTRARIAELFVIDRDGERSRPLNSQHALRVLLENCDDAYGFPPYEFISPFLQNDGGVSLVRLERAIIEEALESVPASLHQSRTMDWADRLPSFIDQAVERALQEPEIAIGLADFESAIESVEIEKSSD